MSRYLTNEELEKRALALRTELGLDAQAQVDMMTIIQKLKHADSDFNYLRVPDSEMPDAEAQWDSDKKTIRLRESVFQGMQAQQPRARMTVAHEIAHVVLGHDGLRNRSINKNAAERFDAETKREEGEARRLAAMFLAPAHLIRPADTAQDISAHFGLSAEAAAIRREEVRVLERRASGKLRELPREVVDYLREAKRRGQKVQTDIGDDD